MRTRSFETQLECSSNCKYDYKLNHYNWDLKVMNEWMKNKQWLKIRQIHMKHNPPHCQTYSRNIGEHSFCFVLTFNLKLYVLFTIEGCPHSIWSRFGITREQLFWSIRQELWEKSQNLIINCVIIIWNTCYQKMNLVIPLLWENWLFNDY